MRSRLDRSECALGNDRYPLKAETGPANPTGLAHTYELRAGRRRGRRTKGRLRDRRAAGNGDYLGVDVDGRVCARGRYDPRFCTRPKRPHPVADKTVKRMVVRVNRLPSDAMGGRVVLAGAGRTCIVTVVFVRDDGRAADESHGKHGNRRDARRPDTKPLQHLWNTA